MQLSDIGNRKGPRFRRQADFKACCRRLEYAHCESVVARAEARNVASDRDRLGAGMHSPYDRAGHFGTDLVLDDDLPPDQRRATPNRAGRFSVSRRQIEDCPFAVSVDAIADDRRTRVRQLEMDVADYERMLQPIVDGKFDE